MICWKIQDTRGVTRLDDARGEKQVWRPVFKPDGFRKPMYCIDGSTYDIIGSFWRTGNCAPFTPSLPHLNRSN